MVPVRRVGRSRQRRGQCGEDGQGENFVDGVCFHAFPLRITSVMIFSR
jgi:hypothetical protein